MLIRPHTRRRFLVQGGALVLASTVPWKSGLALANGPSSALTSEQQETFGALVEAWGESRGASVSRAEMAKAIKQLDERCASKDSDFAGATREVLDTLHRATRGQFTGWAPYARSELLRSWAADRDPSYEPTARDPHLKRRGEWHRVLSAFAEEIAARSPVSSNDPVFHIPAAAGGF